MSHSYEITWNHLIKGYMDSFAFLSALLHYDSDVAAGIKCYPPRAEILNAFILTELKNIKVVIIGQDPYHQPGQAMGLSFSVRPGCAVPPTLNNIYKELQADIPGFIIPSHGCLTSWAKQGVLLLNSILTVQEGKALSHADIGWEWFTNRVIEELKYNKKNLVYMLWGSKAKTKCKMIDRKANLVLECAHPSPLSAHRGFFGCRHFSQANAYLQKHGKAPIDWQLPLDLDEVHAD